jgi:pyruvate kinase
MDDAALISERHQREVEDVFAEVDDLLADVNRAAEEQMSHWRAAFEGGAFPRATFEPSALNLAAYLALRSRDLRPLQRRLMALGLSSLGRAESRVIPTLTAVRAALAALLGRSSGPVADASAFFAGEDRLHREVETIFGNAGDPSDRNRLLVTCPCEAADDPEFMMGLARRGVDAVRINCAHDDASAWARMVGHARAAGATTGRRMKIFMDLGGPKIRTGKVRTLGDRKKARPGDLIAVVRSGKLREAEMGEGFAVECALAEAFAAVRLGDRVFLDDGKLAAEIERLEPWGVVARVSRTEPGGLKLKPEKALNFPDTALQIDALTDQDRKDLAFVAAHADAVEYSFVQTAKDVQQLQAALAEERPKDWREVSLVLKIETARAVAGLPEMIVQAASRQPTAVMIARGDLSVEIGFARTAEMQEEILWIGEAAATPVIWATQVLEDLVKTGVSSRGEMTDAAMAARAECVMLNKGEYLMDAIDQLQGLLARMEDHQHKKAPMLRKLQSW